MKTVYIIIVIIVLSSCVRKNDENIIATVGDRKISKEQIDNLITPQLYEIMQRLYVLRKAALDETIKLDLLEMSAKNNNIPIDTLLERFVIKKITIDEINSYIQKNDLLKRGVPSINNEYRIVDVKTTEGAALVREMYKESLILKLIDSLKTKYEIKVFLVPPIEPKIDLNNLPIVHYRGNLSSSVTLIEVSDFDCDNCRINLSLYRKLYEKYKDKVKFGFTHFSGSVSLAATAAEAGGRFGKFWEMHDIIFNKKRAYPTDTTFYLDLAKNIGIDSLKFLNEMQKGDLYNKILKNIEFVANKGLQVTPTIIVNGKIILEADNLQKIETIIEEELKK